MAPSKKHEIITFKVDESLSHAMQGIGNRSEFIRRAILAALENVCPLCLGAGTLSPEQRDHWDRFAATHNAEQCEYCHAIHIVCAAVAGSDTTEHHAH